MNHSLGWEIAASAATWRRVAPSKDVEDLNFSKKKAKKLFGNREDLDFCALLRRLQLRTKA